MGSSGSVENARLGLDYMRHVCSRRTTFRRLSPFPASLATYGKGAPHTGTAGSNRCAKQRHELRLPSKGGGRSPSQPSWAQSSKRRPYIATLVAACSRVTCHRLREQDLLSSMKSSRHSGNSAHTRSKRFIDPPAEIIRRIMAGATFRHRPIVHCGA